MELIDALCILQSGWTSETKDIYDKAYSIVLDRAEELKLIDKINKLSDKLKNMKKE